VASRIGAAQTWYAGAPAATLTAKLVRRPRRTSPAGTGFDSPLRHRPAASTCLAGGHALWWHVEAADAGAALALLPRYLRPPTSVTSVRDVEIP
jgi:hypothetical protein